MFEKCVLNAVLAFGAAVGTTALAVDGRKPREELATAVPEGIRLLKEQKYEAFVTSFVAPEELERVTNRDKMTIKEFARSTENDATMLLDILQGIEGKKPDLLTDGGTATFLFEGRDIPAAAITFVKVDQSWYLKKMERIPSKAELEKRRFGHWENMARPNTPEGHRAAEPSNAADSR